MLTIAIQNLIFVRSTLLKVKLKRALNQLDKNADQL